MKPEEYLKNNPWCSNVLMDTMFPHHEVQRAIERGKIQTIPSPWGTLMALPKQVIAPALHLYRLESARQFALLKWGPRVTQNGISPAPMSSGRYSVSRQVWDIFVDPGGVTPEGIDFIRRPPVSLGESDQYRLILASHSDRKAAIAHCVREKWCGPETWVGISPVSPFDPSFTPDSVNSLERVIPNASSISTTRSGMSIPEDMQVLFADRVIKGGPGMIYRLALAGDCPLLSLSEYSLLERDMGVIEAWQTMVNDGWLIGQERKTLASKSLTMLGMVWGASADDLLKHHPWPLTVKDGKLEYQVLATDWHAEHLRLVRQMALSFVDGSRRMATQPPPRVQLSSLVSSRLRGVAAVDIGNETGSKVIDALLRVSLPNPDGSEKTWDVLLGIDRGTFLLSQQEERIIQQQDIWQESVGRLVTQVWVFADPVREERIMANMNKANIPVWSTTLGRIRLAPDLPYWNNTSSSVFSYDSISGAAPFRPIWMRSGKSGLHSFLDYESA